MIESLKSRLPARKVAVFSNVGGLLIFARLLCVLFVFVDLPRTHPSVEFAVAGMYLLLAVLLFFTLRSTFFGGGSEGLDYHVRIAGGGASVACV